MNFPLGTKGVLFQNIIQDFLFFIRCSTWNMFKIIAITILFLQLSVLIGCEKPNPEPEKLDQVYEDLEKQAAAVGADIANFQTQLDEHLVTLKKAEPQTGQIKYAQKHVYETSAIIDRLKQKKTLLGNSSQKPQRTRQDRISQSLLCKEAVAAASRVGSVQRITKERECKSALVLREKNERTWNSNAEKENCRRG
jgi:low affinity Fe/Cu permease